MTVERCLQRPSFDVAQDIVDEHVAFEMGDGARLRRRYVGRVTQHEDVVVPLRSYIPLIQYTQQLKKDYSLATPTFGHAADGN